MEAQALPEDVSDPRVWWRRMVDAVIAMRAQQRELVADYLRWVEKHRTREIALAARDDLGRRASHAAFADVEQWPAWGYRSSPEAIAAKAAPSKARKK